MVMRVALSFPGCHRRGGVERVTLECANFLSRRGHHVHLFACEWDEQSLESEVVRHQVTVRDHLPLARLRRFSMCCGRVMRKTGLEFDAYGGFGAVCPPGGVVWVQSVHQAWLEISQTQRGLRSRLKQKLNPFHGLALAKERACYGRREYRKLIALTPEVKADLMRCYDVPEEDIATLPNGFAPEEFNPAVRRTHRSTVRRELGYQDHHRVVVFVANELDRKGFFPLLRAIASVNDPRIHLLAVGRLNERECALHIARLGMADRVRFTGPTSDAARYYAAADAFALPTTYEAWGLVIVEALACGLPVLTSRLAGAAVAVEESRSGELLDDPRDVKEIALKLRRMFERQAPAPEQIAASVHPYAWPEILKDYESLLVAQNRQTTDAAERLVREAEGGPVLPA